MSRIQFTKAEKTKAGRVSTPETRPAPVLVCPPDTRRLTIAPRPLSTDNYKHDLNTVHTFLPQLPDAGINPAGLPIRDKPEIQISPKLLEEQILPPGHTRTKDLSCIAFILRSAAGRRN